MSPRLHTHAVECCVWGNRGVAHNVLVRLYVPPSLCFPWRLCCPPSLPPPRAGCTQVRHVPFMAPSEFRAVLLDHQRKALEGNILHINLSTSLKEVAAKGRRVAVDAHTGTRVGQRLCTCCLVMLAR